MAFDKTKVVRAAEKYLAQGKIPAAIKEYRAIVEHDASDFTALNMLGDLYARAGNKKEATIAFTRIAEHYREQGFALKSIAMYKKVERLQPGSIEIASQLAALYEMHGLTVDARTQYLIVADALSRAKQTPQALGVLRKVADLDPHNVDIRLRLAEGYTHENLKAEAGEAYAEAGVQLLARKQYERAVDALTKALNIDPRDKQSLNNLLQAHQGLGTPDEAAEVLESAVAEHPGDVELLSMLVAAYVAAEDAPAAERVATALLIQESSAYMRFADVARLYLHQGDANGAARVLAAISEQMLNGREEDELVELLDQVLARDPEQLDALRLLVRVHTWQHDDEKLRGSLEQLAEAAEASGHADDERSALIQLVRLAPAESRFRERLQTLGGAPESFDTSPASDTPYASLPMSGEVPTFESFMVGSKENSAATTPAVEEHSEFEWNTVAEPEVDSTRANTSASFSDLNESWTSADDASTEATGAPPVASSSFQEFDFNSTPAETPIATNAVAQEASPSATPDARRETMLRQELESVDFYLAQGYTDIARDTLEMLERQFGAHAEIDARRSQLQNTDAATAPAASTTATETPAATVDFSGFALYDTTEETASPTSAAMPATDDVDAAFTNLESPFAAPSTPTATDNTSAPPAPADAPLPIAPPTQHAIDPGLAAIFDEFRTASEEDESAISNGDYETHYNLGLAYKEMDLMDDAVEEFQSAAGLASPQDGTPRYLQCCNLLGHCFMQKKMARLAVMWLQKGLNSPGHTEDEYQALRFDLGLAFEQMGELDKAIDTFMEVYGVDVSYRGVADKLRELQAQRAAK